MTTLAMLTGDALATPATPAQPIMHTHDAILDMANGAVEEAALQELDDAGD